MQENDTIQQLSELINADITRWTADPSLTFRGTDWYHLTDAEAEVFELDHDDMPRLVTVFLAYEEIVNMREGAFPIDDPLRQAVLAALPWLTPDTRCDIEFERFACLFQVSSRQAHGFFWKVFFWQKRQGYVVFRDPV